MMLKIASEFSKKTETILFLMVVFMCFFVLGCSAAQKTIDPAFLTVVNTKGITLELHNQQNRCSIRLNDSIKSETLGIPYPCGFVRADEKLEPQTYFYKGIGNVFVVAGPLAEKGAYTKDTRVNIEHMCSDEGQVVVVQDNQLRLLQSKKIPLGFCHRLGFDEKDYYGFVHPVD